MTQSLEVKTELKTIICHPFFDFKEQNYPLTGIKAALAASLDFPNTRF